MKLDIDEVLLCFSRDGSDASRIELRFVSNLRLEGSNAQLGDEDQFIVQDLVRRLGFVLRKR